MPERGWGSTPKERWDRPDYLGVAFLPHESGPVDPSLTATFLSSQESVISAEAWTKGETLLARVTVSQDACVTETDLLEACIDHLGMRQTPKAIWLERRAKPAA